MSLQFLLSMLFSYLIQNIDWSRNQNIDLTEEIIMFCGYMRTPSYSQQRNGLGLVPNISFKKLRIFLAEL